MVKRIQIFFRKLRFKRELRRCEEIGKYNRGKHIVVCLKNKPLTLNKRDFKQKQKEGLFLSSVSWGMLVERQVTRENLNDFF